MVNKSYFVNVPKTREQFFLVGMNLPHESLKLSENTLAELERLTETAGAEIAGKEILRLREINSANFIGKGHAETLASLSEETGATGIVFDVDLSPAQNRNLEEIFGKKVLDRSMLILDIFAQHALSREGKLQVELAQLEYLLPRLRGMGKILSRLGGGIGTRGPGETKLETDRRRILKRISRLKHEIKSVGKHRATQRRKRLKQGVPSLSLIGYTNAGKSTLLNALTDANVLVEDKLFSTLDPTARKLILPGGSEAVLIDTVGFIRKLPHTLVASFRATLEETNYADLLLLVADVSSPLLDEEIKASREVLRLLKITDKTILTVLNKIDRMEDSIRLNQYLEETKPSVCISAKTGKGLDDLLNTIESILEQTKTVRFYQIPYHRFDLLSRLQSLGDHINVEYLDEKIRVSLRIEKKDAEKLEQDKELEIGNP